MTILNEDIQILVQILNEICLDKPVPRCKVQDVFQERTSKNIERYIFENSLSDLIHNKVIQGFYLKQGKNGGICKEDQEEPV